MMFSMLPFCVSVIFVVSIFVGSSDGISCYVCSSLTNSNGCGESDFYASAATVSNSKTCTGCSKTVMHNELTGTIVTRACEMVGCSPSRTRPGASHSSTTYCCNRDTCNNASHTRISVYGIIAALCIYLINHLA